MKHQTFPVAKEIDLSKFETHSEGDKTFYRMAQVAGTVAPVMPCELRSGVMTLFRQRFPAAVVQPGGKRKPHFVETSFVADLLVFMAEESNQIAAANTSRKFAAINAARSRGKGIAPFAQVTHDNILLTFDTRADLEEYVGELLKLENLLAARAAEIEAAAKSFASHVVDVLDRPSLPVAPAQAALEPEFVEHAPEPKRPGFFDRLFGRG